MPYVPIVVKNWHKATIMKRLILFCLLIPLALFAQYPDGKELLAKIDKNMSSESRVFTSKMIIHGRRGSRTIEAKTSSKGNDKAFTEYLYPAREQGTKMLKLKNQLWIYSPSTDRTIQISGHMLRQSVMGSDMSYEDVMEDPNLALHYNAKVSGEEKYDERNCWILELDAFDPEMAYQQRKIWVDKQRFIPLKEEMYARGGKMLKRTTLSDVENIQGRWFPMRIVFKDVLKEGDGTEFLIENIKFNENIPEYVFSKASLKK
jgi:outer membrane lipoprotein-sorting protein